MRQEFEVTQPDGKNVKLVVRKPEYEDIEHADKVYAIKISSLIKENAGRKLLSRQELNKYLKEAGIWTEAEEKEVEKLQTEVADTLTAMRKGGKGLTDGRSMAIKVMDRRQEIMRIMAKKQSFDDVTLESFAETEKIDYLVYCSTLYADSGSNYWDSFEDMKNDKLSDVYRKASVLSMKVIYDIDNEFDKNLPENKWLKKYGFIDEELNYTDRKTGEKVDREGKPIKELEEKIQKIRDNIQGDIVEEAPFIDEETGKPVELVT